MSEKNNINPSKGQILYLFFFFNRHGLLTFEPEASFRANGSMRSLPDSILFLSYAFFPCEFSHTCSPKSLLVLRSPGSSMHTQAALVSLLHAQSYPTISFFRSSSPLLNTKHSEEGIDFTFFNDVFFKKFSSIRIAPIFIYDTSKDRFLELCGTLVEAFFFNFIYFLNYNPKTKLSKFRSTIIYLKLENV